MLSTKYLTGEEKACIEDTLALKSYQSLHNAHKALQGSIWKATKNGTPNIIKVVKRSLHDAHITYHNQQTIKIDENIVKESQILKYLTDNNPPPSLTKYIDFFSDKYNYYLVMENGGDNFFQFVKKCHEFISNDMIEMSVWHSFCKTAMQQIVDLIDWMHNTMKVCHLDVSLENLVINNVNVEVDANTNRILSFNDFQIKIIDFGLAEMFSSTRRDDTTDFGCTKYVGKPGYQSPEVFGRKEVFDGRSADCWSLGICFFTMIVGSAPFESASMDDALYRFIMNHELVHVLRSWNRMHYVTSNILDLIYLIFVKESHRLNIQEIGQHRYFTE